MYSDRPFVIYLAGKMSGLTKEEMNYWRTDLSQKLFRLAHGEACRDIKIINPVDYYNTEDAQHDSEKEFVRWELRAVMNSDLIVADSTDSIGTAFEIAVAYINKKPVVLFRRDLMATTHPFVAYCGDKEFEDIGEMAKFIFSYYVKV